MDLRDFIEKYRDEINNKNFEEVYNKIEQYVHIYTMIGKLTDLFYKCGIDPLKYMTYVPKYYAFGSSIKTIDIPNNIKSIDRGAFSNCISLTSVNIPDNVTSIGEEAFRGCASLTSITIPDSIIQLDNEVFAYCRSLVSVTIGSGVKYIYSRVFARCSSLKTVNYRGSKEQWESIWKEYNRSWGTDDWDYDSEIKSIICSDGVIKLG